MSDPMSPGAATAATKDPENGQAVIALVFGVVGVMGCQITAPIALFLGWAYMRDARARGYEPDPLGLVGMILGAVGSVLLLVQLLIFGGVCTLYGGMCCCSLFAAMLDSM